MISCEANNVGKDKCTSDLAAYLLCCAAPFPTLPNLRSTKMIGDYYPTLRKSALHDSHTEI